MTQPTVTLPVDPATVIRLDEKMPLVTDARWGATVYVVSHHPEGDRVQVVVAPGPDLILATRWDEGRPTSPRAYRKYKEMVGEVSEMIAEQFNEDEMRLPPATGNAFDDEEPAV